MELKYADPAFSFHTGDFWFSIHLRVQSIGRFEFCKRQIQTNRDPDENKFGSREETTKKVPINHVFDAIEQDLAKNIDFLENIEKFIMYT